MHQSVDIEFIAIININIISTTEFPFQVSS